MTHIVSVALIILTGIAIPNEHDNRAADVYSTACEYDNPVSTLGIGVVKVPANFTLFNDSSLVDEYASHDMYAESEKINLCSKFFKPDYGIMHFACVKITSKSYKILVNYSDFKYVSKTQGYEFSTWNKYILESYGMRRKYGSSASAQPLRTESNDKASLVVIPDGQELFCPIELKGNWVNVTYDCFYNTENTTHEGEPCHDYIKQCNSPITGWLRWKKDNDLLIDIFLLP